MIVRDRGEQDNETKANLMGSEVGMGVASSCSNFEGGENDKVEQVPNDPGGHKRKVLKEKSEFRVKSSKYYPPDNNHMLESCHRRVKIVKDHVGCKTFKEEHPIGEVVAENGPIGERKCKVLEDNYNKRRVFCTTLLFKMGLKIATWAKIRGTIRI